MHLSRRSVVVSLAFALLLPTLAHSQEAPARLDAYVDKALRDWNVPGVSIAIVKDDKVVLTKGYGLKRVGTSERVDAKTIFGIASNTKAFAAASLAILVDEGKLRWDDPVSKYLPALQMKDAWVTRELRIRDLLAHRNGLPPYGGDIMTWGSRYTREEVLARIRHVEPVSSFRSEYAYQNGMFIAAGEVVEAVTGKSWDDFVRERFFVPLGMTSTNTSIAAFPRNGNVATPHFFINGKHEAIPWRNIDNLGAAAVINSNADDLAQWLRLQLGSGTVDGKKFYSAEQGHEMWMPQIALRIAPHSTQSVPVAKWSAYGLGWSLRDYHGRRIVRHGGWTDGMVSTVAMIPEERLGVAILSNSHNRNLTSALMYRIFDSYLGVKEEDWSAMFLARVVAAETGEAKRQRENEAARVSGTRPSLPLDNYVGTYSNVLYGDVIVSTKEKRLFIDFTESPTFKGELVHWHYDTFRSQWRERIPDPAAVVFTLDAKGEVRDVTTTLGDFIDPASYTFTRKQ